MESIARSVASSFGSNVTSICSTPHPALLLLSQMSSQHACRSQLALPWSTPLLPIRFLQSLCCCRSDLPQANSQNQHHASSTQTLTFVITVDCGRAWLLRAGFGMLHADLRLQRETRGHEHLLRRCPVALRLLTQQSLHRGRAAERVTRMPLPTG